MSIHLPLVCGDMEVRFPNAFTDIVKSKAALDLEVGCLNRYKKDRFLLSVMDTTDYRTFGYYPDLVVRYKNGIVYLVGDFDKYEGKSALSAYYSILVRVFLWVSQCGYHLRIVESEDAIEDDSKSHMGLVLNPETNEFCFYMHRVHRREMFRVATQVLSGRPMIKGLMLIECGPDPKNLILAGCLCREIYFEKCELQESFVESLSQCKNLELLKLFHCDFPAKTLRKVLYADTPNKLPIKTVDLTGSTLDAKAKALFWSLARIRFVDVIGIEDSPDSGRIYYADVYESVDTASELDTASEGETVCLYTQAPSPKKSRFDEMMEGSNLEELSNEGKDASESDIGSASE